MNPAFRSDLRGAMEQAPGTEGTEQGKSGKTWLKRIGVAGFLFFLIKGLIWIGVFAGLHKLVGC